MLGLGVLAWGKLVGQAENWDLTNPISAYETL